MSGIEYFTSDDGEWKLDVKGRNKFIEEIVGHEVLAFADNDYGDYLFLKPIFPAPYSNRVGSSVVFVAAQSNAF